MENKWLYVAVLVMACMMHGVVGQNSTNTNGPAVSNSTLTQTGPLNVTGNLTQTGPLNVTGNLTQTSPPNVTGNLTQTGPLNVTGNLTQTGPLNVTGNLTQTGSPSTTQVNVTKANCKKDRACFSTPVSCDPSIAGSCFFVSTRAVSGNANNLTFELSGESRGYIAVSLSRDNKEGNGDTVYACANNNGTAKFIQATLNNSRLTQDNTVSSGIFSGSVSKNKIQCIFVAPGLSSTRAANTSTFVFFFTGNFTNGTLESPVTQLFTNTSVDPTNSNSTDVGIITPTTAGGSNALHHAASQAALVILSGIITVLLL